MDLGALQMYFFYYYHYLISSLNGVPLIETCISIPYFQVPSDELLMTSGGIGQGAGHICCKLGTFSACVCFSAEK